MKKRLFTMLTVLFLLTVVSVPAVSAEPAPAVSAGAGIGIDIVKEILSPITEGIPLFLKECHIDLLKNSREQLIKQLSDYRARLKDFERECLQNQAEIIADYNKIVEKRKASKAKIHHHPLVKASDEMWLKKRLKENIKSYECVLNYIASLEKRIIGLDKFIEQEEKRYQDMVEDNMKGHEIMTRVKALEEENQQMKEENRQIKEESKQLKEQNGRLCRVIEKLIGDNRTMLDMLERGSEC